MASIWYYSRLCVECTHALFWLFLIYAAVAFQSNLLLLPLVLLALVPIGWKAASGCPLSILENYLYPIDTGSSVPERNRTGAKIRLYLGMNLQTWDVLLISLTCLLTTVLIMRFCLSLA